MSRMLLSRTLAVSIASPIEHAYAFLMQPENWPRWASGLGQGLRQVEGGWIADTPIGEAKVRFSPPNGHGVLDHWVTLPSGVEIYLPMRLIENGRGCDLLFTLFRQPDMDDAAFARDAEMVERDLKALKALLEAGEG